MALAWVESGIGEVEGTRETVTETETGNETGTGTGSTTEGVEVEVEDTTITTVTVTEIETEIATEGTGSGSGRVGASTLMIAESGAVVAQSSKGWPRLAGPIAQISMGR